MFKFSILFLFFISVFSQQTSSSTSTSPPSDSSSSSSSSSSKMSSLEYSNKFTNFQTKIKKMKNEAELIYSQLKSDIGGENNAMLYMIQSLNQAEHSLQDVIGTIKESSKPVVGSQVQHHIVREIVSTILQFIGLYGITITFGSLVYYFINGLILSGGFLTASFAFIPSLYSSSIMFPPILLLIEAFFGFSFIIGIFSWLGLSSIVDSYGYLLLHPQALEQIGMFTLLLGVLSSLFKL